MADLSTKARKALPKEDFAVKRMPKTGKPGFPMNDREHIEKAAQLAPRSYHAGNISKATEEKIEARAHKMLKGEANHAESRGWKHTEKAGFLGYKSGKR